MRTGVSMPEGKRQRSRSAKRLAKLGLSVAYALKTNGQIGADFAVMGSKAGRVIIKAENGRTVEVAENVDESTHKPSPVMGFDREFLYAPLPVAVRKHNLGAENARSKNPNARKYLSAIDADYKRRNGIPRYEDPENNIRIY
jgi:hypothetical protein